MRGSLAMFVALLIGATGLNAVAAPSAEARGCGWISAAGASRYVEAEGVSCRYGRAWSRRMLAGRGRPGGWDRCWSGYYRGGCARGSGTHFLYHP